MRWLDVLFLAGLALIDAGIGLWSIPAALITAGLMCVAIATFIQLLKSAKA